MSKSEILYVKGMNISESEGCLEADDDIWDDTQLNHAYDKAIRMANVEVAKRLAMSTNSKHAEKDEHGKGKEHGKGTKSKKSTKKIIWNSGMKCRAVYEGDGLEYEAYLVKCLNDRECVVRFLGYDNSERVPICSLKPSLGQDAQQKQIEQALLDVDESVMSEPLSELEKTDRRNLTSPGSTVVISERSYPKKAKSKKKKSEPKPSNNRNNGFQLPELPMPNINGLRNLGSMDIPMPPPPLAFPSERVDCEDQAVSSMLLSWYMSGYYTGLYQGLKRSKEGRKKD